MRDIPPVSVERVTVARFHSAMRGETEVNQAWGVPELLPMAEDESHHFQRVDVFEHPQTFSIPPANTSTVRIGLTHGENVFGFRHCAGHCGYDHTHCLFLFSNGRGGNVPPPTVGYSAIFALI